MVGTEFPGSAALQSEQQWHLTTTVMISTFKALVVRMNAYLEPHIVHFLTGVSSRSIQRWRDEYAKHGRFDASLGRAANGRWALSEDDTHLSAFFFKLS